MEHVHTPHRQQATIVEEIGEHIAHKYLDKKKTRMAIKANKLLGEFRKIQNKLKKTRLKYMSSMDRTGAIILTRLMSGSSDLEVSLGRRHQTPVLNAERLCKHCKGNVMEKIETLKHA